MLTSCKHCESESGRCSQKKMKQYTHCPHTDPSKCQEYQLKRKFFGISDWANKTPQKVEK